MKSLCTSGVQYGWPLPRPRPSRPPLAIPYRPWAVWYAGWVPSIRFCVLNGCSQTLNRVCTWENSSAAANAPTTNAVNPMSSHEVRDVAM